MRINKKLIIGFFLGVSIILAGGITIFIIISLPESIESKIQQLMAEYEIPSFSAGIVINDKLVWVDNFGVQDDEDTVFMIGSITKTFTAAVILQLMEQDLIDLDDDINMYLPFDVRHPDYPMNSITIRMLLTHNSGLAPNLFWSLEYYLDKEMKQWIYDNFGWEITIWEPRPSLEQFLNESLTPSGSYYDSSNWCSAPSTGYHYSNAGFQLLGYLIEQVTNQSLIDYVEENIFEPLNMINSGYFYEDFVDKHAIPYEWVNGSIIELPLYNLNVTGAGSIKSTIHDMANYLMMIINKGEYNGARILDNVSVDLMQTQQIPVSGTSVEGFNNEGYGLGWCLYDDDFVGHGGATPGFNSHMYLKRTESGTIGVIIMYNRGSALFWDEVLVSEFIPKINSLIKDEAERIFQNSIIA